MALIAVVCVIGVVSGELIGPMAELRPGRRDEDDNNGDKRPALRAELADDAFQFTPSEQPFLLEVLGPRSTLGPGLGRTLPFPAFLPVSVFFDGSDRGGDNGGVAEGGGPSGSFGGPGALTEVSFTSSGGSSPPSDFSPSQPYLFNSAALPASVSPPPPPPPPGSPPPPPPPIQVLPPPPPPPSGLTAVPEPDSWMFLIVGMGAAGLALRRRRAGAGRSLDEDETADLQT